MDEKERLIISHLRKDARLSLGAVSQALNVPLSSSLWFGIVRV